MQFGANTFDNVACQRRLSTPSPACDGVSQYLRVAGVVFKGEQRIVTGAAGTPEAETVFADQRGDIALIQQLRISGRVLQIPEHISRNAGDAVRAHVGQVLVPAGLFDNFGTLAQRTG